MLRELVADLLRLEEVNRRAITSKKWRDLGELQDALVPCLEACRAFCGFQTWEPIQIEPMPTRVLLERKRQAAALADTLQVAMQPMGAPLHTDLQRMRGALARQIGLLEQQPDPPRSGDWWLAEGYRLEKILGDLVFPTSLEFDDQGRLYVLEGGFSYLTTEALSRVLRLDPNGPVEIAREFRGPATSLTWHQGSFYIAEGGRPAQVTRLSADGRERTTVIGDLHTGGDHFTTDLVVGPDGALYFGVGSVTNSAVVGLDSLMAWATMLPEFHDVSARDLKLRGINFEVPMPMGGPGATATTGAFKPLGQPSKPGEIIPGRFKANGVIYRVQPDGSAAEIYADGLRNPFGIGFDPGGRLIAVDQGMDVRGARPIANDWEPVWEIKKGRWYGWPDFASGLPVTNPRFKPEGMPAPQFLLAEHPPLAGQPLARLMPHSGSVKFVFGPGGAFGHEGEMFLAQVGDFSPMTQPLPEPQGYRVVRVNLATGQESDFYVNLTPNQEGDRPERPVAVKFAPDGSALYILDFGLLQTFPMAMVPKAGSGALWRVTRANGNSVSRDNT
jgi:glucose/arabinose dehydrogenase